MVKNIIKFGAVLGVSLALSGSVALAEGTDNGDSGSSPQALSIYNTGPWSKNKVVVKDVNKCKVKNVNNVGVGNSTNQKAKTGKAKVAKNTTGGNATSGNALNDNLTTVGVDLTNSATTGDCSCGCEGSGLQGASISTTGPGSWNTIYGGGVNKQSVVNKNNVSVSNSTSQHAKSGDASVYKNTTGGDATSGDAENINTTDVTISISNN